jgi:hypothetical protein
MLALAGFAAIFNERTREVPESPPRVASAGYLERWVSDRMLKVAIWASLVLGVAYWVFAWIVSRSYWAMMATLIPAAGVGWLLGEQSLRRDRQADVRRKLT